MSHSESNLDDLPESAREIAEVIGREKTLFMLNRLPSFRAGVKGKESRRVILYVPKHLKPDHRLVQILGLESAQKLVDNFGGEIMQPANCHRVYVRHRNEAVKKMLADGCTPSMISDLMGISIEQICNIARRD